MSCLRWERKYLGEQYPGIHWGNCLVIFSELYFSTGKGNCFFKGCLNLVLLVRVQISKCLTKYFQLQLPSKSRKETGCFSCCNLKRLITFKGYVQACLSENVRKWTWIGIWTVFRNLMQCFVKPVIKLRLKPFSQNQWITPLKLDTRLMKMEAFLGSLQLHNSLLTYCLETCNHVSCFSAG